ncbi:MAG: hypothetical protein ABSA85_15850 [Terracidiphilus sp.]|jgi:hypothetical protein
MKRGIGKRLLWTGVASPFIMLAVYALRDTGIGSLFFPVYMPWFILMAFVFPQGASTAKIPTFVWAALGINFLLTWITLLVAVLVIGKLISLTRKRKAQE